MEIDPDAFREFERRAHDRVAPTYVDFLAPVTEVLVPVLLDAAGVQAGRRVLDVATGPGALAAAAAARGATAVGVDLSPAMVALARGRHPGVDFREADAERLPFAAASFDAVVCNFGLGHFARPEHVVAEFVRVLAPGGYVALSWWDVPSRTRLNGVLIDAVAEIGAGLPAGVPPGPPLSRFSDDAELRALLTIAGLQAPALRTVAWTHIVPSVAAWWDGALGSMVRMVASVRGQPADVQARIRAAFERRAAEYRGEGGFLVPTSAKVGSGRRP